MTPAAGRADEFVLDLPGGGRLHLQTLDEVELLEAQRQQYLSDYEFDKLNDRVMLGSLLTQQLALYRAQQTLSGMQPEFDAKDRPTGHYTQVKMKPVETQAAHNSIEKATGQIIALEKALGIDKKTRESSGAQTLQTYLVALKRAARAFGVHINERTKKYEAFVMELRVKLRLLENADAEDRQYHGISQKTVLEWASNELGELEKADQEFAQQKGQIWRGKL